MKFSKRCFDIFFSFIGIIFLIPLFLVIALLIKVEDGGPVFFRQERIGYMRKPFRVWKFRTMVVNAERQGLKITVGHDPRITRVGGWLRKFKLDEFPQLFNVLRGEMSFVGPRPEVSFYVEQYDANQQKVLDLMPGITDIASIKFFNENDILGKAKNPEDVYVNQIVPEKIRLNIEYAARATLWSDFKVILTTILKIFSSAKGRREVTSNPKESGLYRNM